jgi:hypothetical protein
VDRILAHLSNIGEAPGALYSFNGTPAREEKNVHEQNEVTVPASDDLSDAGSNWLKTTPTNAILSPSLLCRRLVLVTRKDPRLQIVHENLPCCAVSPINPVRVFFGLGHCSYQKRIQRQVLKFCIVAHDAFNDFRRWSAHASPSQKTPPPTDDN